MSSANWRYFVFISAWKCQTVHKQFFFLNLVPQGNTDIKHWTTLIMVITGSTLLDSCAVDTQQLFDDLLAPTTPPCSTTNRRFSIGGDLAMI